MKPEQRFASSNHVLRRFRTSPLTERSPMLEGRGNLPRSSQERTTPNQQQTLPPPKQRSESATRGNETHIEKQHANETPLLTDRAAIKELHTIKSTQGIKSVDYPIAPDEGSRSQQHMKTRVAQQETTTRNQTRIYDMLCIKSWSELSPFGSIMVALLLRGVLWERLGKTDENIGITNPHHVTAR